MPLFILDDLATLVSQKQRKKAHPFRVGEEELKMLQWLSVKDVAKVYEKQAEGVGVCLCWRVPKANAPNIGTGA